MNFMSFDTHSGGLSAVFALGILFSFRFSADTYMMSLFAVPIGRIYTHVGLRIPNEQMTLISIFVVLDNDGSFRKP
jgi:hypothetical protein